MELKRSGSQAPIKGSPDTFTGEVTIEPLFQQTEPARVGAGKVTFAPGARSAWHIHPLGQGLIVTDGIGWTQCWGEEKVEIRAGDIVTCPPGKKHWHGATATAAMTHIAVQETLNGKNVEWLEKVSDEQYQS
jgi:quercetin dioxygenase-like cupin family protein